MRLLEANRLHTAIALLWNIILYPLGILRQHAETFGTETHHNLPSPSYVAKSF